MFAFHLYENALGYDCHGVGEVRWRMGRCQLSQAGDEMMIRNGKAEKWGILCKRCWLLLITCLSVVERQGVRAVCKCLDHSGKNSWAECWKELTWQWHSCENRAWNGMKMPQGFRNISSPMKKGFSGSPFLTLRMILPIKKNRHF